MASVSGFVSVIVDVPFSWCQFIVWLRYSAPAGTRTCFSLPLGQQSLYQSVGTVVQICLTETWLAESTPSAKT